MDKKSRCRDRLVVDGKEIDLHPDNMNGKGGLSLSRSWIPLLEKEKGSGQRQDGYFLLKQHSST
jgi:hypothetical protein